MTPFLYLLSIRSMLAFFPLIVEKLSISYAFERFTKLSTFCCNCKHRKTRPQQNACLNFLFLPFFSFIFLKCHQMIVVVSIHVGFFFLDEEASSSSGVHT